MVLEKIRSIDKAFYLTKLMRSIVAYYVVNHCILVYQKKICSLLV